MKTLCTVCIWSLYLHVSVYRLWKQISLWDNKSKSNCWLCVNSVTLCIINCWCSAVDFQKLPRKQEEFSKQPLPECSITTGWKHNFEKHITRKSIQKKPHNWLNKMSGSNKHSVCDLYWMGKKHAQILSLITVCLFACFSISCTVHWWLSSVCKAGQKKRNEEYDYLSHNSFFIILCLCVEDRVW